MTRRNGGALLCSFVAMLMLPSLAYAEGKVFWKNVTGKKIAVHTVDTFDAFCAAGSPGGTSNFTLEPGGEHELKLVDDQFFCWTWRFDDDPSTEPDGWCRAAAGDVISVKQGTLPGSKCKEKIKT